MFDIGWTEMLVIAVVMIVVVGPKDLPKMLRTFGKTTAKMRSMAGDFQKQFNEALKEAELDDIKKSVDTLKGLNPATEIKKQLNPFEKAASDVRAGLDAAMKPKPTAAAAAPAAVAAEPLKNGPISETPSSAMPGASAPLPQAAAASPDPAAPPPQAQPAAAAAAVAEAAEKPVAKSAGAKAAGPKAAPKGSRAPAKPAAAKAKAAPRKKSESSAT
jgi:sec-independent protein translocase protein TatB